MFTRQNSIGVYGMDSYMIKVEADVSTGMVSFDIVGLPDAAVKESRDRVRAAIKNSEFDFPVGKITINLAPADIRKEGSMYDLPVLVAILVATGQMSPQLDDAAFIGELSLDGELRPVNGLLAMAIKAKQSGIKRLFVPKDNASEGAVVDGIKVYPISHIKQMVDVINGNITLEPAVPLLPSQTAKPHILDFSEVKGQLTAKKALAVAAAGGHNVLMIGPPGSGKSMLAKRFPSILPEMTFEESIETTQIHSVAGALKPNSPLVTTRPFRAPHHTISAPGLSGGGSIPKPGEISLAHNGVLFLDELPEFKRDVMEALRQPLEDGTVTISRVAGSLTYPCNITMIAAMNPCPCGYYGHPTKECTCSAGAAGKYLGKISGPMLDRLDIHVEVPPVQFDQLHNDRKEETSAEIKKKVDIARKIQVERYKGTGINCNARLLPSMLEQYCVMSEGAAKMLRSAFDKLGLSGRAYDRLLKVSRTLADLDESKLIEVAHIAQAIQFRSLDRKYWNAE